jgi:TPR repeat protein
LNSQHENILKSLRQLSFKFEYHENNLPKEFEIHYMNRKFDYEKTLKFSNESLKEFPLNIPILVLKAECLMKLDNVEESKRILKMVTISMKPYSATDEFFLGEAFLLLKQNKDANMHFQKSMESGSLYGYHKIGNMYFTGESDLNIKSDKTLAIQYLQKAANEGFAMSEYNIGYCYYMGQGLEKDRSKAMDWFEKSSNHGYAVAQFKLGQCLFNGTGVIEDKHKGEKWITKAAEYGHPDAILSLELLKEEVKVDPLPSLKQKLDSSLFGSVSKTPKKKTPTNLFSSTSSAEDVEFEFLNK